MLDHKYGNVLTIILIIAIIGIIGLLIFLGIDLFNKYYLEKDAMEGVSQFDAIVPNYNETNIANGTIATNEIVIGLTDNTTEEMQNTIVNPYANMVIDNSRNTNTNNSENKTPAKVYYKGFVQEGTISIPSTGLSCPILENATKPAIEVAVGIQVGPRFKSSW